MCGIVGATGRNIDPQIAKDVFLAIESRGTDAAGFFTHETGVIKSATKVSNLLQEHNSSFMDTLANAKAFIGHTRLATHGSPKNNKNNHPIESPNWWLVHNGQISLKDLKDYDYNTNTDSENILAYIEHFGLEEGLSHVNTNAAIILMPKGEENCIYFMRTRGSSASAAYVHKTDTIYVSSGVSYLGEGINKGEAKTIPRLANLVFSPSELYQEIKLEEKSLYKLFIKSNKLHLTVSKIVYLFNQIGDQFIEDSKRAQRYTKYSVPTTRNSDYIYDYDYDSLFGVGDLVRLTRNPSEFLSNAVWGVGGAVHKIFSLRNGDVFRIERTYNIGYTHQSMRRYIVKKLGTDDFYNIPQGYLEETDPPDCFCLLYSENTHSECEECVFFEPCKQTIIARKDNKQALCKQEFDSNSERCSDCPYVYYCVLADFQCCSMEGVETTK